MMLDYLITWNGQEYVAESPGIPGITGHSQLAVYAVYALVCKLKAAGHETGPLSIRDVVGAGGKPAR